MTGVFARYLDNGHPLDCDVDAGHTRVDLPDLWSSFGKGQDRE